MLSHIRSILRKTDMWSCMIISPCIISKPKRRTKLNLYCHIRWTVHILLHYTGLFKMTVRVQFSSSNSAPNWGNNHHLTIPFEVGIYIFKRQGVCVSRTWGYESERPLKPSPLTCYKQFVTNSIILLMFVESQRVHI